jgi:hypothetical protein
MPTLTNRLFPTRTRLLLQALLAIVLATATSGCGGEPSQREIKNAQVFEALLTAISLKHPKEVERDADQIATRHRAGEISDDTYRQLSEIIAKAQGQDWSGAESAAYEFRKQCGDRGSFFK